MPAQSILVVNQIYRMSVDALPGTLLGTIEATDPLGGELRYTILTEAGHVGREFLDLDFLTGELRLASALTNSPSSTLDIMVGVSVAPNAATPLFATLPPIAVGSGPNGIITADLNGDGILDLAMSSWFSNSISLLIGDGAGGFDTLSQLVVGVNPVDITQADFNHDGAIDLAVANYGQATIRVALGDGLGNFDLRDPIVIGSGPVALTASDFNGDGNIDIAVSLAGAPTVTILLGDGAGEFTITDVITLPAGSVLEGIIHGDLNQNGTQDLMVANPGADTVSVLNGNNTGQFTFGPEIPVGLDPREMTLTDLNADGLKDLAVLNNGEGSVSILIRNEAPEAGFTSIAPISVGNQPWAIAHADFNLDGAEDLAVANYLDHTVSILIGKNSGEFDALATIPVGAYPRGFAEGDFNQDGAIDLAVTNLHGASINVLLNQPQVIRRAMANITVDIVVSPVITTSGSTTVSLAQTSTTLDLSSSTTTIPSLTSASTGSFESSSDGVAVFSDPLVPAIISAVASGSIGLAFFLVQKVLERKLQTKLDDLLGIDGEDEVVEFQKLILVPIVQKLSKKIKLTSCMQTTNAERLNEYVEAVRILVSEFYRQGFAIKPAQFSAIQRSLLTSVVAQEIQAVLLPDLGCCSCQHISRFFKVTVSPDAIINHVTEIADAVIEKMPEEIKQATLSEEVLTLDTEAGCQAVCRRLNESLNTHIIWRVEAPTQSHPIYSVRSDVEASQVLEVQALVKDGLIKVKGKKHAGKTEMIISQIDPTKFRQLYAQSIVLGTFHTLEFGSDQTEFNADDSAEDATAVPMVTLTPAPQDHTAATNSSSQLTKSRVSLIKGHERSLSNLSAISSAHSTGSNESNMSSTSQTPMIAQF